MKTTTQSNLKRIFYRTILLPAAMGISLAAYSQTLPDTGNEAKQGDPAVIINNEVQQTNPLNIYPDPFCNSTQISYSVLKADRIKLSVRDNTGKVLRVILDENKIPGVYTLEFSAESIPEGVYYCVMETSSLRASKRMVIIRQ